MLVKKYKKEETMKKKIMITIVAIFLLIAMSVTALAYSGLPQDELSKEEILVEVLYNEHDEKFILDAELDDGTKVKEYDYTISYRMEMKNTKGFYPIGDYFSYAAWITRDGVVSLSLTPKPNVRTNEDDKDMGWLCVASPTHGFASSPNWDNGTVMEWQYDCHYHWANNKTYWNLEPHRTAGSYLAVVLAACNP